MVKWLRWNGPGVVIPILWVRSPLEKLYGPNGIIYSFISLKYPDVETDAKEIRLAQKLATKKNPQFLSNQADIQTTLPTHELSISTKLHNDWKENKDFLVCNSKIMSQSDFFCISL